MVRPSTRASARAATCPTARARWAPACIRRVKNENLETAGYPVGVIVKGQKAMPVLGPFFTDQQVANVVNYIRTHFGNKYKDKVKPEDVKLMR